MSLETQIADKRIKKEEIFNKMEKKKEEFLTHLVKFTESWIDKETLSTVKEKADVVVELGEERARELKSEVGNLKLRSSELVKEYMEKEDLWWHLNEDEASYYSHGRFKLLEVHDKQIKLMLGELGALFTNYGLIEPKIKGSVSLVNWEHVEYNSPKLQYGSSIEYSDEMYENNRSYIVFIQEAQELNGQIAKLEDQKKKENVEEWWETL